MNKPRETCRRGFLRAGLAGGAALVGLNGIVAEGGPVKLERPSFDGLKVGVTSYTWREFSLEQAIAMTVAAGVKYISLKDMHLPLKSSPEQRREVSQRLKAAGLTLMGCGVIYLKNDPVQIREAFEYAKDAEIPTIVCSPEVEALPEVERVAREFKEIRVAIHNHGPGDKHYPSPFDVMRLIEGRDTRLGVCIDVGHTVRLGLDPMEAIRKCAGRLYDFHMKDVTTATAEGKPTEVGKGVIDIAGVLRTLVELKWSYHVALEYEANGKAPVPGVTESLAFMRGVLAAL